VVIALFTLGRPDTPKLSDEPVSFDGVHAATDLRTIAEDYPQRVAGSDPDNRCGLWVLQQFKQAGLETHIEGFPATVNGKDLAVQNVYAVSRGESPGTILFIANRDVPPLATQGANDNASGVAALVELARSFTVTAHDHTIIFLCTSGDAFGALGSRRFLDDHRANDLYAVIALREMATRDFRGIGVNGWSPTAKTAPPWLWLLAAPAARVAANSEALLPGLLTQMTRLAVPTSSGSQGPFVAAGIPGVTVSAAGSVMPVQSDTMDTTSTEALTRTGSVAQAMVMAIDGTTSPGARSGGAIFLTRQRTLPGGSLVLILVALLVPLVAVSVDLFAHCRRERVLLRPAVLRSALHLAPWLVLLVIVYLANVTGQLPHSPGAIIPPDSSVVGSPRYLRVAVLLALLLFAYGYAVAVERRLERRVATDPRATIFAAHAILLTIALLMLLVDPFSVLLVLPAAVLWPMARPGGWARSILPAYLGLVMIPLVLAYYASLLGVGWKVWWYFFLLLENRTIPTSVVLLAALFVSTTGVLAHTLHERGLAPGALTWPAIDRRGSDRPSEAEWSTVTDVKPARAHRRPQVRGRKPDKQ
jgi:hypothetical protein